MSLLALYQQQLQTREYHPDQEQESVIRAFTQLAADLSQPRKSRHWFWQPKPDPLKGIYLWGGVGRGKTWLMDLFHQAYPELGIERHHFHAFMREIHGRLKVHEGQGDPMTAIAREMAGRMRVLCLDEFNVIDIGDAMLMRGLLTALYQVGIVLVTTSNQPPDRLYWEGLQREQFLPAIELLNTRNRVIELSGEQDYRLQLFGATELYHTPLGDGATIALSREFDRLVSGVVEELGSFPVPGRAVRFVKRCNGVIWCDFNALCGPPRWQNDYLELARCHHTLFISDIPQLDGTWDDRSRRFINLIDVLYDRKVNVVISADAPPDTLYLGQRLAFEFKRTASRLKEMQSDAYLETAHLG
ncbi:MAG: cell division protein ZapE [Candidatus Thiodiazotropha sp.]